MTRYVDPKNDLTFKRIFGEHPHLLISFLNALMPLAPGRRIESLEYLLPEQLPENPLGKNSIVDVKCIDNFGRQFIVEMQMYWSEIEDQTREVSADLLESEEIKEALALCEEGAFTVEELEIYDQYWDRISTEKGLNDQAKAEGEAKRTRGRACGRIGKNRYNCLSKQAILRTNPGIFRFEHRCHSGNSETKPIEIEKNKFQFLL
jgi:hypothetical protein